MCLSSLRHFFRFLSCQVHTTFAFTTRIRRSSAIIILCMCNACAISVGEFPCVVMTVVSRQNALHVMCGKARESQPVCKSRTSAKLPMPAVVRWIDEQRSSTPTVTYCIFLQALSLAGVVASGQNSVASFVSPDRRNMNSCYPVRKPPLKRRLPFTDDGDGAYLHILPDLIIAIRVRNNLIDLFFNRTKGEASL